MAVPSVRRQRGRWTRDRQVNRPTVGSTDRLRHKQRQVITNRCSGGQPVRQSDRAGACCVRGLSDERRHLGLWAVSRCSLGDRRLRRTELSLYPPSDCHCLRQHGGSGKIWEEFLGWRGACVSEWTGIPRHYILFRMPIKPATVKWLLCVTPSENVVNGFLLNKRPKRKRNNKNMLWFSSCATWFMDNLNGNGSRKVHDCHVFGLLRRWHKTELPFSDFFFYNLEVWLQDVA